MRVQVILEDKEENYREVINVENVLDKKHFSYVDSYGATNNLRVFNDGITIFRLDEDHKTFVVLRKKSFIEVKTSEGSIKFSVKILALNLNNDIISIGYCVSDYKKHIEIRYLGE